MKLDVNLIPGEKLLIKIWDTLFDKGLAGLVEPWQHRRKERSRQQMMIEMAQTEKTIEDIRNEKIALNDHGRLIAKAGHGDTGLDLHFVPEDLLKSITSEIVAEEIEKKIALSRTILFSEEEAEAVGESEDVSDQLADPDWVRRWKVHAQEARHEHMQRLWAKVLAGELKVPGSYSLRTLDVLHVLTKSDADLIVRLAPFVIANQIFRGAEDLFKKNNLSFQEFLLLEEQGIVSGMSDPFGFQYAAFGDPPWSMVCHDKILVVTPKDNEQKEFQIGSFGRITNVGREILSLGTFRCDIEYMKLVGEHIKSQGFSVSLGGFLRIDGNRVRTRDLVEL